MRAIFVISAVVFGSAVFGQDVRDIRNMPKYDVRYDYLDVDAILDSKRLVRNYVDCLINSVRCTPEGKALKRILPEALRTKCARCTDRQKRTAVKVIRRLKYEYPEEWGKLSSRWDPTGDFTRFFEEYLAKETFNTISGTGNEIPGSPPPRSPPPVRIPLVPVIPVTSSTPPPTLPPRVDTSTQARPAILNRFGDEGELVTPGPSPPLYIPPGPTLPPLPPTFTSFTPSPEPEPVRPVMQTRPSNLYPEIVPTRFPLRPATDMPPPYSTAITLIDQIGYKIIRTTELVTDILRNTVRAVVG